MSGISQAKSMFFDRAAVLGFIDKKLAKALSKIGAYIRQSARQSIRDSETPSKPGQPPHSHLGAQRRKLNRRRKDQGLPPVKAGLEGLKEIYFFYEPERRTVVVGPVKYNLVSFRGAGVIDHGTVPEIMEKGGDVTFLEHQKPGEQTWKRVTSRRRDSAQGHTTRNRTIRLAKRPFMVPALEREVVNLPSLLEQAL